jgi:hypothetical protein
MKNYLPDYIHPLIDVLNEDHKETLVKQSLPVMKALPEAYVEYKRPKDYNVERFAENLAYLLDKTADKSLIEDTLLKHGVDAEPAVFKELVTRVDSPTVLEEALKNLAGSSVIENDSYQRNIENDSNQRKIFTAKSAPTTVENIKHLLKHLDNSHIKLPDQVLFDAIQAAVLRPSPDAVKVLAPYIAKQNREILNFPTNVEGQSNNSSSEKHHQIPIGSSLVVAAATHAKKHYNHNGYECNRKDIDIGVPLMIRALINSGASALDDANYASPVDIIDMSSLSSKTTLLEDLQQKQRAERASAQVPQTIAEPPQISISDTERAAFFAVQNAVGEYAKKHPGNVTGEFLQEYFAGTHIDDNNVAVIGSDKGKLQALERLKDLQHIMLGHQGQNMDQPIIAQNHIADVLEHMVSKPTAQQAKQEQASINENEKHIQTRRELLRIGAKAAIATVLAPRLRGQVDRLKQQNERKEFVGKCMSLARISAKAGLVTNSIEENFGKLYDDMKQTTPKAEALAQLASAAVGNLVDGTTEITPNAAAQYVELLASQLQPRIEAIIAWNQKKQSGFVSMDGNVGIYSAKELENAWSVGRDRS